MRARLVLLSGVILTALIGRAEILDRIAVTVGEQVITESDLITNLRVAALLDRKPVDLSAAQRRKAAARLVDQALILKEAEFSRAALPSADDAARLLQQVKSQYPSEEDYQAALKRYQVTEEDVVDHLAAGLRALRFTDLRFRPEIEVTPDEVRQYYDQMAAKSQSADPAPAPSFEASRDQIEKLLTDQRVAEALDRWLATERNDTDIVYREQAFQ